MLPRNRHTDEAMQPYGLFEDVKNIDSKIRYCLDQECVRVTDQLYVHRILMTMKISIQTNQSTNLSDWIWRR